MIEVPTFALEDGEHSAVTRGASGALNSCELGDISEMKFEIEAITRGWLVASPRGRARDFDCIIKRQSTRPITVQIKKARKQSEFRYLFNTSRGLGKNGRRVAYSYSAFDVLAVHLSDLDRWIFFSRQDLGERQGAAYTLPENRKQAQHSHSMDARNPDNWELLDRVAAMHSQESGGMGLRTSYPTP